MLIASCACGRLLNLPQTYTAITSYRPLQPTTPIRPQITANEGYLTVTAAASDPLQSDKRSAKEEIQY